MTIRQLLFSSGTALLLGTGIAQAGPCNTASKDAGSGPTPGYDNETTGNQTTGVAASSEHPPTSRMNRATDNVAASSQDAQKQMQGQPTASQRDKAQRQKPVRITTAEKIKPAGRPFPHWHRSGKSPAGLLHYRPAEPLAPLAH